MQQQLGYNDDSFEPGNAPNTSAFEKFGQSDVIPGLVSQNKISTTSDNQWSNDW